MPAHEYGTSRKKRGEGVLENLGEMGVEPLLKGFSRDSRASELRVSQKYRGDGVLERFIVRNPSAR